MVGFLARASFRPCLDARGGTHSQDNPLDISNMNLTYDYYQENENTSTDEEKTQKRERRKTHGIHSAIGNHRVHVTLRNLVQASSTCPRGGRDTSMGQGHLSMKLLVCMLVCGYQLISLCSSSLSVLETGHEEEVEVDIMPGRWSWSWVCSRRNRSSCSMAP